MARRVALPRTVALFALLFAPAICAVAQKKIACPDGDHFEIDVRQLSLRYDASGFAGTLSSLSVLGARLEVAPKTLQQAAVATQQWDELLKGLAAGYNACAITRQQYADGITHIYPRLQQDGASLEEIRKAISAGQKADTQRLQRLIDSFYANLRQFAQISGKEIILERIAALSDQVATGTQTLVDKIDQLNQRFDQLEKSNKEAPLPTPQQVGQQLTEVRKNLLAKADQAEAAYNQGYALLNQYRFAEAIPLLQQALAAVPLPDFYLALGRAYRQLPDLPHAEKVLREGLKTTASDEKSESDLANQLGLVLLAKGDLDAALQYTLRALKINEKVYGPDNPEVAVNANNIGQILLDKGDLDGALQSTLRALRIDEKVYGQDHPTVAVEVGNIGLILQAKGDLDGALQYAQRALKIDEKVYGPEHHNVARDANNIGQILQAKGDLDGALHSAQRALKIDEKVYGPEHHNVARDANNIGQILQAKGDLDGALQSAQRSRRIDEKLYGQDHPTVAIEVSNIGKILQAKGDLEGALQYAQHALKLDEKLYGQDHPTVAIRVNNIGQILHDKGDLDGALQSTLRALRIGEKVYGPDNPNVAIYANNIGQILLARGDLDAALQYAQRALRILQDTYGPDNPATKTAAASLEAIKKAMHTLATPHPTYNVPMPATLYAEALDHLQALGQELAPGTRRKWDLAHMRTLAAALGDPQQAFPSVLIAGTNGKGSTAATLASILTAAGYRTALYTSPHLVRVNERIQVNSAEISDAVFARLYFQVDTTATRLISEGALPHPPSFFEVLTAVAFLYFAESKVDIAVLEVGLGGRLDATNIVEPLISILTDIALDHQEYLGSTIAAITAEKCGILRPNGTLITLPQHPEANQAIGEAAATLNLRALSAANFIPAHVFQPTTNNQQLATNTYTLTLDNEPLEVDSPLPGHHQQRNIALAIAAAQELRTQHGYSIPNILITNGITATRWPGRLELIPFPDGPPLLLDVAHNPAGAWTLRAAIAQLPEAQPRTLIFSCLRDKSLEEMSRILFPLFDSSPDADPARRRDHLILAPIDNPRARTVEDLLAAAHTLQVPAHAAPHLEAALAQARAVTPPDGLIVATGSVYLIGALRHLALLP